MLDIMIYIFFFGGGGKVGVVKSYVIIRCYQKNKFKFFDGQICVI